MIPLEVLAKFLLKTPWKEIESSISCGTVDFVPARNLLLTALLMLTPARPGYVDFLKPYYHIRLKTSNAPFLEVPVI